MYQPPSWWWEAKTLLEQGQRQIDVAKKLGISQGMISKMKSKMAEQEIRLSENKDPTPLPVRGDALTAIIKRLTKRQPWEQRG